MHTRRWLLAAPIVLLGACAPEQPADNPGMPPGLGSGPGGGGLGAYPVQFSCPANGTIVETTNGVRRYFGSAPNDPELCVMQRPEDSRPVRRVYSFFTYNPYDSAQLRAAFREFFPLHPGKQIRHSIVQPGSQFILTFTAVARQSVSVPAGTFDAWVIDLREEGIGFGAGFEATRRTWMEASNWFSVKETYRIVRDPMAVNTVPDWEATRIFHAPPQ